MHRGWTEAGARNCCIHVGHASASLYRNTVHVLSLAYNEPEAPEDGSATTLWNVLKPELPGLHLLSFTITSGSFSLLNMPMVYNARL